MAQVNDLSRSLTAFDPISTLVVVVEMIDPVLMIRMLVVGYVFAIRSERALCREVQLNLAYRWFCGLGIEDNIPDHSAFSRARNERFGDSDIFARSW